ncbi:cytochrome c oxidase subunit II [Sphingomonas sp.]|jgi:cytochrome c oxidase subunit 2|uniref:cytochrome c oxidase subunit II n=1 Tax=Sphingomonas sp. TaxID=28214 RepID=UPI002E3002CB|nr:cytochrome c oxidase subunit II [Sphingomonas sp.]HEX4695420.1 cytochrome c oxidase subunit II [Sphingomonas sp.]
MSAAPLAYLSGSGERANTIVPLTWYVLVVSIVVCIVIAALLWGGVRRARFADSADVAVERGGNGLGWIKWGVIISAVPLAISLIWTMAALGSVVGPPRRAGLTIDVTAHQYWWEVRYDGASPSETFLTANEIHIPTGVKVLVRLHGGDVIHSFWVPQLSGKTDAIPGQINLTWLQADSPGRYRGQCSEYCGLEHAEMGFEVVADPPADFARWRMAQLQTAPPPATDAARRGQAFVQYRCAMCHAVRGTLAASHYGPDLTHLMSRRLIAAGMLLNNRGNRAGWIEAPQTVKPGALMPNQKLTGQQLNDLDAYLETLK